VEERATRPFQSRFAAVALRAISRLPLFIYLTGAGTTPPGPASSPMKRHEERGTRDEALNKRDPILSLRSTILYTSYPVFSPINDQSSDIIFFRRD
jgi:hypothetical protein